LFFVLQVPCQFYGLAYDDVPYYASPQHILAAKQAALLLQHALQPFDQDVPMHDALNEVYN